MRAIAAELREGYDRLIAPYWSRIRAVLDADIAYRAQQLAAGGADRLFADLHPDLKFRDGRLTLVDVARGNRPATGSAPRGLVLISLVLGPPYVLIKLRTTTQTTERYPARGVGALCASDKSVPEHYQEEFSSPTIEKSSASTAGRQPVSGSAVRLLGRPRAELLDAMRSPATTTELARASNVTPSAASQHLRVLRDSGLVARERYGRSVLHVTTERGMALLQPWPAI